jgi:CRISPR-associated endonuclease/helicase Cas3
MAMERAHNKASRLIQIENLLLAHPEGLTQAELARRLQVNRSTINRYIPDLPKHIYIELDGCWKIDRTAELIHVRLNLHEALAVHLASRLLARRMDRQNPHAASALRKIGTAMERWAKRISRHVLQSAEVMEEAAQRHDPVYLQALEKLTQAWAEQRKVQIWHRKESSEPVTMHIYSPYFIEPYAVGQTTFVIGYSDTRKAVRTFKIERIERVELTHEAYEIPADFDPRSLLADAWGIWYTEAEPVAVVLKFHPRVIQRVKETRWHRSQELEDLADGYLLWKGKVAEPREMLNWIRGWGADCEVLEPDILRDAVMDGIEKLMNIYKPR